MSAGQLMSLPLNIPWCLVGVSDDMIDQRIGADRFPPGWRSSIAIYAYQPSVEVLDTSDRDELITDLKVTCSVTGYQPTEQEVNAAYVDLDLKAGDFRLLSDEYFACYGAHLNISVLPLSRGRGPGVQAWVVGGSDLSIYPHIVSFEPKKRDLYQASTETNEILTASAGKVSTDKTNTNTSSVETGISAGFAPGGGFSGIGGTGSISRKWGEISQDQVSTARDASRERRETEGTTTQLNQVYSLLTGLHEATNRCVVSWFPNPNQMSVSDRRTFPRQITALEGVQDVFLIVSRPSTVEGICVEASLDTGHYPERPRFTIPPRSYVRRTVPLSLNAESTKPTTWEDFYEGSKEKLDQRRSVINPGQLADGWEFDWDGAPIDETGKSAQDNADDTFSDGTPRMPRYRFHAVHTPDEGDVRPHEIEVLGTLIGRHNEPPTIFDRTFDVRLRRPAGDEPSPVADIGQLLVAHRDLQTCLTFPDEGVCPTVVDTGAGPAPDDNIVGHRIAAATIVEEPDLRVDRDVLVAALQERSNAANTTLAKEFIHKAQRALLSSERSAERHATGAVGYYDTRHFTQLLVDRLSADAGDRPLANWADEHQIAIGYGASQLTVAEALRMPIARLAKLAELSLEDTLHLRRRLLGRAASRIRSQASGGSDTQVNSGSTYDEE